MFRWTRVQTKWMNPVGGGPLKRAAQENESTMSSYLEEFSFKKYLRPKSDHSESFFLNKRSLIKNKVIIFSVGDNVDSVVVSRSFAWPFTWASRTWRNCWRVSQKRNNILVSLTSCLANLMLGLYWFDTLFNQWVWIWLLILQRWWINGEEDGKWREMLHDQSASSEEYGGENCYSHSLGRLDYTFICMIVSMKVASWWYSFPL